MWICEHVCGNRQWNASIPADVRSLFGFRLMPRSCRRKRRKKYSGLCFLHTQMSNLHENKCMRNQRGVSPALICDYILRPASASLLSLPPHSVQRQLPDPEGQLSADFLQTGIPFISSAAAPGPRHPRRRHRMPPRVRTFPCSCCRASP